MCPFTFISPAWKYFNATGYNQQLASTDDINKVTCSKVKVIEKVTGSKFKVSRWRLKNYVNAAAPDPMKGFQTNLIQIIMSSSWTTNWIGLVLKVTVQRSRSKKTFLENAFLNWCGCVIAGSETMVEIKSKGQCHNHTKYARKAEACMTVPCWVLSSLFLNTNITAAVSNSIVKQQN